MTNASVGYVLLTRDAQGWRTTVAEIPAAKACGRLPNSLAKASFAEAAAAFEDSLRQGYGLSEPLSWREVQPDWWAADVLGAVPSSEWSTSP